MSHVYCPECGYNNPEVCALLREVRRGARRAAEEGEQTESFAIAERRTTRLDTLDDLGICRAASSSSARAAERRRDVRAQRTSPTVIGRSPECGIFLDDVTVSRKHAVLHAGRRALEARGSGQPQRHVRQPRARRLRRPQRRRRDPDRQVPAHLPPPLADVDDGAHPSPPPRFLTIGTVCSRLHDEFPDVSISKIRYLEDQGLLTPRRTQGGYRLFSEDDVERLETILRLQRDEFLPLRVIKEELAAGAGKQRKRRRTRRRRGEEELDLDELCARAGITASG